MPSDKHIIVTGHSNISWKDAIVKTVSEVSQTIKNLNSIEILSQRAIIDDDRLSEYLVDLDISLIFLANSSLVILIPLIIC